MPTNQELHQKITEELRWDPRFREAEIGVAVANGVVTLTGHVTRHPAKAAAVHAVERVHGVRAVANQLQVRIDEAYAPTDSHLAEAVANALEWDIDVPERQITVRIERGWVVLEGEVDWHFQRQAAEAAVRHLFGVKGISNLLRVAPCDVPPAEVKKAIEVAIRRSAAEDARHLSVEAHEGTVVLRGTVRSWPERELAESAAWSTRGVTSVVNQIDIASTVDV